MGTAGKERVGPTEREALNIYITIRKIRQPEGICSMAQGARIPCSDSLGVGWGGDMCVPTAESSSDTNWVLSLASLQLFS